MRLPRRHDFDLLPLRALVIEYEYMREIILFLNCEVMRSKNQINDKDEEKKLNDRIT